MQTGKLPARPLLLSGEIILYMPSTSSQQLLRNGWAVACVSFEADSVHICCMMVPVKASMQPPPPPLLHTVNTFAASINTMQDQTCATCAGNFQNQSVVRLVSRMQGLSIIQGVSTLSDGCLVTSINTVHNKRLLSCVTGGSSPTATASQRGSYIW